MSSSSLQDTEMEDLSHIPKQFTHSVIKWNIEHFCLLISPSYYRIESPEFYINAPQLTKWRLNILYKDKDLSVYLELLEFQPNFQKFFINWKLCLMHQKENFNRESFHRFTKKCSITIGRYELKDILNELQPFRKDELNLQCRLCASLESVNKCDNFRDISALSQDLSRHYRENKNCDIVLKVRDNYIYAHKAILIARNDILANQINKNEREQVIELPDVDDYETMKAIVEYLYSGSVQPLLYQPPDLLHKCADLFNISELLSHAFSDQIMFSSSIKVQEFTHTCNISDLVSGKEVHGTVKGGILNTTLQFHLCRVDRGIRFKFQYTCGLKQQGVCVEFGIFDAEQNIVPPRRKCYLLKAREVCKFDDIVDKNSVNISPSVNGDLRIRVKVRMTHYEKTQITPFTDSFKIVVCENCEVKLYNSLSKNIKSLLESCMYSDIKVTAKTKSFKVHKSILSARSSFFSEKINALGEKNEVKILNISDLVFRVVLLYIYSGTLESLGVANMELVYEVAEVLRIYSLKDACSRSLQRKFTVRNVYEISAFADKMKDIQLKDSAMHFASRHRCKVVNEEA